MPKIEISQKDLEKLAGRKIIKLEEELELAKAELESKEGDILKLDIKDTNRPDLWSVEGVARQLSKKTGCPTYKITRGNYVLNVNKKVAKVRPRIACAVVKNIKVTDDLIREMIQLQEKVAMTFGRKRKEAAIGVYDFDKIVWPVLYTTVDPRGIRFVALDMRTAMTPAQIIAMHPKGKEFAHLLEGYKEFPILIDKAKEVLSMPPIINSDKTGKVTEKTKNLVIEVTGYNDKFVQASLNVLACALADRGGKLESVTINYANKEMIITPNLTLKKAKVNVEGIQKAAGQKLSIKQIIKLLEKARYNAKTKGKIIEVEYPAYRQDILHEVDIIEDVLIAYGYNKFEPEVPKLAVYGEEADLEKFSRKVREIMVGFGAQEIATFTLTNKDVLFKKMNLKRDFEEVAEIENPVSVSWSCLRNWLLPSLLEFLSKNTTKEFPQRIFEVGDVVNLNLKAETRTDTIRRLAFAFSSLGVTFTQAKQTLDALGNCLGVEFKIKEVEHPSFIPGRVGAILAKGNQVGFVGELHPRVLLNFGIETPVVAFELDLDKILTFGQTA